MLIYVSLKCPHCLDLLKSINNSLNFNKSQIYPIFKSSIEQIDSFAYINKLLKTSEKSKAGVKQLYLSLKSG
jgi:hypothetical protein